MEIFSIILILIGILLIIGSIVYLARRGDYITDISCTFIFGVILLIIGIIIKTNLDVKAIDPTALDVYRNKTELVIRCTIIGNDTIRNDSIVVFKNNISKIKLYNNKTNE